MTNRLDLVDTNAAGHIAIGGVDALKLTQQYGTPLVLSGGRFEASNGSLKI